MIEPWNNTLLEKYSKILEYSEALDFCLEYMIKLKNEFAKNEAASRNDEINLILAINVISIIFSGSILYGYYMFRTKNLKKRLIETRKIFLQIPIAILMRQKRIKKYLQDTSRIYLG